jgi:hypothetical protein
MNSSFIIVTTLHPESINTESIRGKLHSLYRKSIEAIRYDNFKVYIFSDQAGEELRNTEFVICDGKTKEKRLAFAKKYLLDESLSSDYILRLDDDDVLNPFAFDLVNKSKPEFYFDPFHSFYSFDSNMYSQLNQPWFANTVIMKSVHAFKEIYLNNALFFNFQHSTWHAYFSDNGIIGKPSEKNSPLYIRIISRSSITSKAGKSDRDFDNYLSNFGSWKTKYFRDFEPIISIN